MNVLHKPFITADEFEMMSGTEGLELVDGEIKEIPMGAESSYVSGELLQLLGLIVRAGQLGQLFPPDAMYRCFPHRPSLIRKPDVSFIRAGRFSNNRPPRGIITLVPDLVVEVVSPNDLYYEVEAKLNDYLQAKVPLIWIVNPDSRSIHVYESTGAIRRLGAEDELTGGAVVPDFRVLVGELLPPPVAVPEEPTPEPPAN